MEHELWITAPFNKYLGGFANSVLNAVGLPATDPAHPWANWLVMELLVIAIIVVFFALVRRSFSVDKPGKVQHVLEIIYEFLQAQAAEVIEHGSKKHIAFFGTLFFFILFMNLIGVIPGFESPTMFPVVPLGLAVAAFLYYNVMGVKANGLFGYLKQFLGPILLMAPLMIPIEIVSHLARPLSLTIRLYANMFAGEQVTMTFLGLTYLIAPALFMALHIFVALLQAYIFTLLTMIYVGGAVSHEH